MIKVDVSQTINDLVEEAIDNVLPIYTHKFEEVNISIDYNLLERVLFNSLKWDMAQRCMWYYSFEELCGELLRMDFISEHDYEDCLMYERFNVSPSTVMRNI